MQSKHKTDKNILEDIKRKQNKNKQQSEQQSIRMLLLRHKHVTTLSRYPLVSRISSLAG
jgi:hypothetical protein